jgi:hypothetical protein
MSFKNVGKVASVSEFANILSNSSPPAWAKSITVHHTAAPSLQQRPKGFIAQHIVNMRDYYQRLGWRSGPHLYADEDQIWFMTPLSEKGVHAVSFNSSSIGIEVLGDYDSEDPFAGRGLQCWQTAAAAAAALAKWLKITPSEQTIKFHRDDPKTSKTCPGSKVSKKWFIDLMQKQSCNCTTPAFDEKQMLSVVEYVVKHKRYTFAEATKLLTRKNNLFFFGNDWLEGATYDAGLSATIAPIAELQQIKNK